MTKLNWLFCLTILSGVVSSTCAQRAAIAHLVSENITGTVTFTETTNGLHVVGTIVGLPEGHYGFHVHELGDIKTCDVSGAHFNPESTNHGGREHEVRHVGDLGNVIFVSPVNGTNPVAQIDFVDNIITLEGRNNILGRTLVLHEQADDLGLVGDEGSLTTGNAGARVACGVIGILSPSDPWNSAVSIAPSVTLFTSAAALFMMAYAF